MEYDKRLLIRSIFEGMAGDARIPGSDVAAHMPTFHMLASTWSSGNVVELGVNRGWSTTALFAGAVYAGKKLISYDLNPGCSTSLSKNLGLPADHPVIKEHWEFRVKDSVEAASDFEDRSVSLWFLDTVHTLEHTRKELTAWLPKMHPEGIMCGHDYYLENCMDGQFSVMKAVGEFIGLHKERFNIQILPYDCGLFILRPKTF